MRSIVVLLSTAAALTAACFTEHYPRKLGNVKGVPPVTGIDARPTTSPCSEESGSVATDLTPLPFGTPLAKISFTPITTARLVYPIEIATRAGKTFVAEQGGKIRLVQEGSTAPVVLNISDRITTGYDEGILGFAIHPGYPAKPYLYVTYTAPHPIVPKPANVSFQSVIARFESFDGGETFSPSSEKRLMVWDHPGPNHNNNVLVFGPDGYLYIGSGDGAEESDIHVQNAQERDHFLGKILRIDVDQGDPYSIPPTNPFVAGQQNTRPEIYAYGLRNVWRFDFDAKSGRLWAGDVGRFTWEEINDIVPGGNYGWGNREGHDCFADGLTCTGDFIEPLVVHSHSEAAAIIGGVFYYGTAVPELTAKYVYADAQSSYFWSVPTSLVAGGPAPTPVRLDEGLPKTRPVSLRLDAKGEILVAAYSSGKILRIGPPTTPAPIKALAETGCVEPGDPRVPRPGAIRYDVNVPQWSDGLDAFRWLSIPTAQTIDVDDAGHLTLPRRSVAVKTLFAEGQNVETQVLRRNANGTWTAETYAWTGPIDAWLATSSTPVTLPSGRVHRVEPQSCKTCHSVDRGTTLGLEAAQLDRDDVDYGGNRRGNALTTLEHIGAIAAPIDRQSFRALPRTNGFDTVEARARAYLHANCSFCHKADEGGVGDGAIDLRFAASFPNMRICNATSPSGRGAFFVPTSPETSLLVRAMRSTNASATPTEPRRMPHAGTSVVDEAGVNLIGQWIRSTGNCP